MMTYNGKLARVKRGHHDAANQCRRCHDSIVALQRRFKQVFDSCAASF